MTDLRKRAHEAINFIPETQLASVVVMLEKMLDPLSLVLLNAPFDDEPEDEEERLAVAESEEWLKQNGGKGIPHEEAMRLLGLD
jgi:hypothetical protein